MKNYPEIPFCFRRAVPMAFAMAVLLLITLTTGALAGAVSDAETAFAKGDFSAAVRGFESALSVDGPSAGLYYNLAMAQIRDNQTGGASLSLRRAIMLDPQMIDARVALSELERSQGVPAVQATWWTRLLETVAERVSLRGLIVAGTVVVWVGAFAFLAAIFRKGPKLWPVVAAVVGVIFGKALFFVGVMADPRITERNQAVVLMSDGISLRSSPADQSAVVAKLPQGSSLDLLGRSGDWSLCRAPHGEKGWVATAAVEPVVPRT